jgi:plastocyanin
MVRIAASFIGLAVAFSSFAAAAPAVLRRQADINVAVPAVPAAAGEGGLNPIDPNAIPNVDVNGSLGNSVELPSETVPPVVTETPPAETVPPPAETAPPVVVETPPVVEMTTIIQSMPPVVHQTQPSWPMYGSGSGGWQVSYNDCVQQCVVEHPMPATVVHIPPPEHQVVMSKSGEVVVPPSSGTEVAAQGSTGVTHDIVIEAAAGVLRAAPAFVKANQGDIVRFVFANGQHQIVESSVIAPCNATVNGFDSGLQSAGGTFQFVVPDSAPRFFFSNVEGECAKGLFGGINAATGNEDSKTTVSSLMPQWASSNADIAAALDATSKLAVQTPGLNWGNSIDVKDVPTELHGQLAENVLYTRAMIARNPEMVDKTGQFNPTDEVVVPVDFATLISVANAGGYPDTTAVGEAPVAPVNAAAAPPTDTPTTDGAGSIMSSRVAYAAVALIGALFMF